MIPSAVTDAEIRELQGLAKNQYVLEVGSLLGYSTVKLAQVAKRVHSVDPHEGYPENNPRPTLQPFLDNLVQHGVRDKVTVHVGRDHDVLPSLARGQFGVAFLDLTGRYTDTMAAMYLTIPLLTHHAALCVHDCGHPDWPGALEAVEKYAELHYTRFRLIDRLAVFEQTWGS